jgi:hypothetical protein
MRAPARSLIRVLYARAAGTPPLGRPLSVLRSHPRVRAFARRHVRVLLARGTTWANVDGALRLLAEDPAQRILFGPWRGDLTLELLYWMPFVRWAQSHFSLEPARIAVASRPGAAHLYAGTCGTYLDAAADVERVFPGAAVFTPQPVLALVERYRSGGDAPRPLLKRARYARLAPPDLALGSDTGAAVAALAVDSALEELTAMLARTTTVVTASERDLASGRAALAGATGLVSRWSGLAVLGVLSGVPTVALTGGLSAADEADLDLVVRIAGEVATPLTILDAGRLDRLAEAFSGAGASSAEGRRPAPQLQ